MMTNFKQNSGVGSRAGDGRNTNQCHCDHKKRCIEALFDSEIARIVEKHFCAMGTELAVARKRYQKALREGLELRRQAERL
jgi:hypothetical protein